MSEENVEVVQDACRRLAEHDLLGDWSWFFDEFAHENLELRPAGMYLDAAPSYQGREGWAQFWRDFSSVWGSGISTPMRSSSSTQVRKSSCLPALSEQAKEAASRSSRTRPTCGR
jgi:hypothetical protein